MSSQNPNNPSNAFQKLTFPQIITLGSRFSNRQHFIASLNNQARQSNHPSLINTYSVICNPSTTKVLRLYASCRHCLSTIKLNLVKPDDKNQAPYYQVKQVNKYHIHKKFSEKELLQSSVSEFIKEKLNKVGSSTQTKKFQKEAMEEFDITKDKFYEITRSYEMKEVGHIAYFEEFLSNRKYESRVEWEKKEGRGEFPEIIVAVSQKMKQNYQQFGDMVIFDIIRQLTKNIDSQGRKFNFGIFSILDCNNRILLAGVAFTSINTPFAYSRAFDLFFNIHQKLPQTVVTDDQPVFNQAMVVMKQRGIFPGTHLLNPWCVVRYLRDNLFGTEEEKEEVIKLAHRFLRERNKKRGWELMEKMTLLTTKENKSVISGFLSNRAKLFPFAIESGFIGIERAPDSMMKQLMKSRIARITSIIYVLRHLDRMDYQHNKTSTTTFQIYSSPVQQQLKDPRVKPVRMRIESKIFSRFLQYYLLSFEQKILSTTDPVITCVNEITNQTHQIADWECSCREVRKSGVPCEHLIRWARENTEKSYLELFAKRWVKVGGEVERGGMKKEEEEEDQEVEGEGESKSVKKRKTVKRRGKEKKEQKEESKRKANRKKVEEQEEEEEDSEDEEEVWAGKD